MFNSFTLCILNGGVVVSRFISHLGPFSVEFAHKPISFFWPYVLENKINKHLMFVKSNERLWMFHLFIHLFFLCVLKVKKSTISCHFIGLLEHLHGGVVASTVLPTCVERSHHVKTRQSVVMSWFMSYVSFELVLLLFMFCSVFIFVTSRFLVNFC